MLFSKKTEVLCVGSVAQDIFFALPKIAILDTPEDITNKRKIVFESGAKYRANDRYESPGGGSANVSQGLARLGISSASYAFVGRDMAGKNILEKMKVFGVDTRLVEKDNSSKTDLSFILIDEGTGERTIFYNRDANEKLEVQEKHLDNVENIFVSSLCGMWEKNLETMLAHVKKTDTPLFYNPGQGNICDNFPLAFKVLQKSTGVFLNKDEAIEIVRSKESSLGNKELDNEIELLKKLVSFGPKFSALTDGDRGAWVFDGKSVFHARIKTPPQVVDTTGAGDAFTSAFLASYLHKKSLKECVRRGVANGGHVTRFYGAREGLLTSSKILEKREGIITQEISA